MNLRLIGFFLIFGVVTFSWLMVYGESQLADEKARIAPLPAREFAAMTLIAVGTGGAYENPARRGPATAVAFGRQVVLVDTGRGVAGGLRNAMLPVTQPTRVLLTNLLPENTEGLDDLLLTGWIQGRREPLRVFGPAGTGVLADGILAAHAGGIAARAAALDLPPGGARFDVTEIGDGWTDAENGLAIRAGALPGGPIEGLAYRFTAGGRSAVVAGAGWSNDALVDFAVGANALVHGAAFIPDPGDIAKLEIDVSPDQLRREMAFYTRFEDVGGIASRAGVETLVLVRLRPPPVYDIQITSEIGPTFDGRIVIPDDGDEITP